MKMPGERIALDVLLSMYEGDETHEAMRAKLAEWSTNPGYTDGVEEWWPTQKAIDAASTVLDGLNRSNAPKPSFFIYDNGGGIGFEWNKEEDDVRTGVNIDVSSRGEVRIICFRDGKVVGHNSITPSFWRPAVQQ